MFMNFKKCIWYLWVNSIYLIKKVKIQSDELREDIHVKVCQVNLTLAP